MSKINVEAVKSNIPACMDFIEKELTGLNVSRKEIIQSMLSAEEVVAGLIGRSNENAKIAVSVNKFMGSVNIRVSCPGEKMSVSDILENMFDKSSLDSEESAVINRFIEKIGSSRISCNRLGMLNVCTIKVEGAKLKTLYMTMAALILGILCGVILKNISADTAKTVSDGLFVPIYTVFLNALKLIVAPLVFFSIADSIAGFSDIRSLGRIAMKVFAFYVVTSILAIGVGFVITSLFPIGDPAMQSIISDAAAATIEKGNAVTISVKDMLVGIVPSDIVNPMLKADMLQLIFLAIMLGVSTSLADSDGAFCNFIKSANKVFSKFTAIIMGFMPLAVFCSMAKMMIGMNFKDLLKVIVWVPSCYAGHFLMLIVYGILLFILAGYNPFVFYKKFMPAFLTGFSTGSSNATVPVSMKICGEELKISPRIFSFSIPLGATLNMDGSCITLVITALFGARIFGIEMTSSLIVALVVAIITLSLGSPGVPGGNLVCAAILMPVIGVPAEAISLIMGLYPLVGMSQTAANVTGDAVVSTIVAKSEGMLELS